MSTSTTNPSLVKVNLQETSLKKMLGTHSDAGYIIISASRGEYDYVENVRRTNDMKKAIDASGYSYIPVWGGFVETNEQGERQEVKEKSFIITNFKRGKGEPGQGSDPLKELGQSLARQFDQESFLFKPQGSESKAYYLDSSGGVVASFNATSPTTAADNYFTNLKKSKKKASVGKSFTYSEGVVYLAKSPLTVSEAIKRFGEIFFKL